MFDTVCKFLIETFPTDFTEWLLGEPMAFSELSPSELSLEPIKADALVLLQSKDVVLHVEFQIQPATAIPFRMLDYRVRVHRRFPNKTMRQVVIYLQETHSNLVSQTTFSLENTQHRFEVIRLWEQDPEVFLNTSGLLPLAILCKANDRELALKKVAEKIGRLPEVSQQNNIAAATAILSGLVLNEDLIRRILRKELMEESVIYQSIKREGIQEGIQQAISHERALIVRLLTRKIGTVPEGAQASINQLPLDKLDELGEALLDFSQPQDFTDWMKNVSNSESPNLQAIVQDLHA